MRENRIRALFVTGSFAYGAAENHTITLMNSLAGRGHECHAAFIKDEHALLDRVRLRGESAVRSLAAQRYLDRAALADLAALIANLQPTAIVATNPYALLYAVIARRLARTRSVMVVTYHSTKLGPKEHLQMLFYRPFFWGADCAIFVYDHQRRYWRRRGLFARRNVVIYDGVDTDEFTDSSTRGQRAAVRRGFGFDESDFVIGAIGDLRKAKNQIQLVSAIERLRIAGLPARALLIGDGPQRTEIQARASEQGVELDVAVTGFVRDVRPYLAACDVVAVCSVTDAMSLGTLEAMALCKPVVHSHVGSAAEMIRPGYNGFLFHINDTQALVEHLTRLTNPDERRTIGVHARGVVEKQFSERTMIERYENLLLKLTSTPDDRHKAKRLLRAPPDGGSGLEDGSGG